MKKKKKGAIIILIIFLAILILLMTQTGFLQKRFTDSRDLAYWEYDENGSIINSLPFEIEGNTETCWLLMHSYGATPSEIKELAETISNNTNNTIVVPRLYGHGTVPSKLYDLSLKNWYEEVETEFDKLNEKCDKVNVAGSSFGGALAIKLSEEKDFNNLYLLNAYLTPTYKWYTVINLKYYLRVVTPILQYSKKAKKAKINDPEGLEKHIAYLNFVYAPVKNSEKFLDTIYRNAEKTNENILIQHSKNDEVASIALIKKFAEKISSETKIITTFTKSNHILLMDYDKEEVIQNIINFENLKS